jgi:hypothetical protein
VWRNSCQANICNNNPYYILTQNRQPDRHVLADLPVGPPQRAAFPREGFEAETVRVTYPVADPVLQARLLLSLRILHRCTIKPVFRIQDPDPNWMRIQSGQWIRIQEGKNDPQKKKKKNIKIFQVLKCWMFSFEG